MELITISREFGSGGRELGKRLADALGYAYFDREIETELARRLDLDAEYIAHTLRHGALLNIPLHFGKTLAVPVARPQVEILVEKRRMLREIAAAAPCVIVGRAADVILADYEPLKLFIYADMAHKVERCRQHAHEGEDLSDRALEKSIRRMDNERAQYLRLFTDKTWGQKERYHLCINTGGVEIQSVVPAVAGYARAWLQK